KAIRRLHELETRNAADADDAEEQEAPKPDAFPLDEEEFLQPLSPVPDPDLVRDLDQLLNETADAQARPRVTVEVEPPTPYAGGGPEGRVTTRPPTLLVPPPPRDLTIHVEEPESYGATNALLRRVGDVLEAATGMDLDLEIAGSRSGAGLRVQGSLQ